MPVRSARTPDSPPLPANEAMLRWSVASERPRVLLVVRWLIGSVRAHLLAHCSALCAAGFRFTLIGPSGESLDRLRADFEGIDDVEFAAAPMEDRRCRLWPTVRALLRDGGFAVLLSHGLTASAHAALANLGIGVPHLVALHQPLRCNQFPGWMGCMKRWMLRRTLLQVDAIVIPSQEVRASLLEHVPSLRDRMARLLTLPAGIEAERWTLLLQSLMNRESLTLPSEWLAA